MGWIVGGGLLFLIAVYVMIRMGGDGLFVRYYHVPDGVDFRTHYRRMRKQKRARRPGRWLWLVIGLGVGTSMAALVVMLLS